MKAQSLIIALGLVFLAGCRAHLETRASVVRSSACEIGVELRRVDSLWSSLAEKHSIKIEYYPILPQLQGPGKPATGSPLPADSSSSMLGLGRPSGRLDGGGFGSVKSIEITTEKTEDRSSITAADSVVQQKAQSEETRQRERATEARHDNGTVLIVSVVAAVAIVVLIRILIKIFLKK